MVSLPMSLSVPLLSVVGWSLVPDLATKYLLVLLHRMLPGPVPLRTSPRYHRHYAATFAFVVLTYLSYNFFASARAMPTNFYQILGVPPNVDDAGLKLAFRQFAKRNHPDRPGVGSDGEELFMMVRDVYEALKDPVVRFAYDRFGPDVLSWTECTTTREYLHQGLLQSSGYHIVAGAALVFWSLVGAPSPVSFWRYTLYAALFAAEMSLILSPSPSPLSASPLTSAPHPQASTYTTRTILHTFFPQRLTHQHILFLHQLLLFLSIALSRVLPVLLAAFTPPTLNPTTPEQERQVLERILGMANVADREASIMMHTLLHSVMSSPTEHEHVSSLARPRPFPFSFPPPSTPLPAPSAVPASSPPPPDHSEAHARLAALAGEMEELIIEANIKKDEGPLRSAWEAAVHLGRAGEGGASAKTKASVRTNFWEAEDLAPDSGEDDEGARAGEDVGASLPSPISTATLRSRPSSPRPSSSLASPAVDDTNTDTEKEGKGRWVSY